MLVYLLTLGVLSTLALSQTTPSDNNLCENGICMPYYQCFNGSISTGGHGSIDKRSINAEATQCEGLFNVCCAFANKTSEPNIDERIVFGPVTSQEEGVGCGYRNIDGLGLLLPLNNTNALYGEFPWTSAVLYKTMQASTNQMINVYHCGGSLIHPMVIITAAHCVFSKAITNLFVRVGEWDTQRKNEPFLHQDRFVSDIVIHENYDSDVLYNDIALLFLSSSVELAENVQTVCLPPPNLISNNNNCVVSGWGKNMYGRRGQYQFIMKKIELKTMGRDTCCMKLRNTRLGPRFELHHSFICAGGELGKDACKGDGGSPLVCEIPGTENRYYLAGSVSWGIGCGDNQIPGVYANVPYFRSWIDNQMLKKGLDISSYIP